MSASPGGCAGASWKLLTTEGCDGSSLDMVRHGEAGKTIGKPWENNRKLQGHGDFTNKNLGS